MMEEQHLLLSNRRDLAVGCKDVAPARKAGLPWNAVPAWDAALVLMVPRWDAVPEWGAVFAVP